MSSIELKRAFLKGSLESSVFKELSNVKCFHCGDTGNFGLELTIQGDYVLSCLGCSNVITHHISSKKELVNLDDLVRGFIQAIREHCEEFKCNQPSCQDGPCSCSPALQEKLRDSLNGRACLEKLSHL